MYTPCIDSERRLSCTDCPLAGFETGPGATDHRNADASITDREDGDWEDWNDEDK